jgi:hypothetical protein
MRKSSVFGACLALALLSGSARASVSYTYEYVTDQSTYSGAVGSTVTVSVLLQETAATGVNSSLINSENGMFSGAFYAVQSNSPSNPATITGVNKNSAFDGFLNSQFNATQARLAETENIQDTSGVGGKQNGNITTVTIGTISIAVGASDTTYTVESYKFAPKTFGGSGVDGNTLTFNNGYDLDVVNGTAAGGITYTGADFFNGSTAFSFTVTSATPEPSSLVLGAVAASGLALGAWRRWRNARRLVSVPTPISH